MTDHPTPIAIIGMSCRLPGDATDPERLWQACAEQRDLWQAVPNERLRDRASYHPDHNRNGTVSIDVTLNLGPSDASFQSNAVGAHFLKEHPGFFDSAFFSVSDLEAKVNTPKPIVIPVLNSPGNGSSATHPTRSFL